MKKITSILFPLIFASILGKAQEYNLITISANGVQTTYALSIIQRIVIEDKNSSDPKFSVVFNNGEQQLSDIKTAIIRLDIPTITSNTDNDDVQIYSNDKTIVVKSTIRHNVSFYNLSGLQFGSSIETAHCECTVTHSGIYIVRVGDRFYKIRID